MSEDVSLLTGGTSGLGGAAAPQLAEAGGTVPVTGRNRHAGEAVADEIGAAHPDAEGRFLRWTSPISTPSATSRGRSAGTTTASTRSSTTPGRRAVSQRSSTASSAPTP